jgi:hypothetical protein
VFVRTLPSLSSSKRRRTTSGIRPNWNEHLRAVNMEMRAILIE